MIGWFTDLLYHICLGAPAGHRLDETTGIALVDEIDLHLHPAWQREVVALISDALPHMQFVFTTHSPLVVGSLHAENVMVLTDVPSTVDAGDGVRETVIHRPSAETFGLGVEQLLTSDAFGLESTRAPAFVEKLREASIEAGSGDAEAALRFMRLMALGEGGESRTSAAPKKRPKPPQRKRAEKRPAPKKKGQP